MSRRSVGRSAMSERMEVAWGGLEVGVGLYDLSDETEYREYRVLPKFQIRQILMRWSIRFVLQKFYRDTRLMRDMEGGEHTH